MPDMLVKLYTLPPLQAVLTQQSQQGIVIRRGLVPEKHIVLNLVRAHFSESWANECDVTFSRQPVSCFIAIEDSALRGFACYDATLRGFFGPTGVRDSARGRGIGTALLLACLHDMRAQGYGYAIIGAAGPTQFYEKIVGAITIAGSSPGIYAGLLDEDDHS